METQYVLQSVSGSTGTRLFLDNAGDAFYDGSSERALWQLRTKLISDFIASRHLHGWAVAVSLAILLLDVLCGQLLRARNATHCGTSITYGETFGRFSNLKLAIFQAFVCSLALAISLCSALRTGLWAEVAALSYIFLLGILQLPCRVGRYSAAVNHHMNAVVAVATILSSVQILLPFAVYKSSGTPAGANIFKLACLYTFCFLSLNARRPKRNKVRGSESLLDHPAEDISPEQTCSLWSYYISYEWLTPLIMKGFFKDLKMNDLPPLPSYESPVRLLARLQTKRIKGGKTLSTLLRVFQKEYAKLVIWSAVTGIVEYIAPFAMFQLLSYLAHREEDTAVVNPFIWISLLFIGPMTRSAFYQRSIFVCTRLSVLIKGVLIQEIYCTSLSSRMDYELEGTNANDVSINEPGMPISPSNINMKSESARIESLVSYDADMVANAGDIFYALTASLVSTVVAMVFLYQLMGWPSLVGVAVLMLLSPLPALFSGRMTRLHRLVMEVTDRRLSNLSEYLTSIRPLKLFGWEAAISERIDHVRVEEQRRIWKRNVTSMLIVMTGDLLSLVSLLAMFSTLVLFTNRPLQAPIAFTALTITEILRAQFIWLSKVIQWVAQGWQSLYRIDAYLESAVERHRHPSGPPAFMNATFRVAENSEFTLRGASVAFKENALNVVIGPTGSGKSSLLLSLLGETVLETGAVTCPPDVAYVPQTAWLQNDSIRGNILFYGTFDELRYQRVLNACDLYHDLQQLPMGDMTLVGEQGSTLSGGQKQRISLARALYSQASLLLLDDIFSALDTQTTFSVYERCFRSGLLGDRTVILVTHFLTAIKDADLCLHLEQGTIKSIKIVPVETNDHWLNNEEATPEVLKLPESTVRSECAPRDNVVSKPANTDVPTSLSGPQETSASGRVPRTLILEYMLLFGGWPSATIAVMSALLVQFSNFSVTLWLSYWTDLVAKDQSASKNLLYLYIYIGTVVTFISLQVVNNFVYQRGGWNAAKLMHKKLIRAVLGAPISWFDRNPVGQALNRFGPDTQSMDSLLVDWLRMALDNSLRFVLRLVSIASIMPIFALPAGIICLFGFATGEIYTRAQISVKRLCSVSFSPILSHFNDTSSGLAVIRARDHMETIFKQLLADKVATNMRAMETQFNCNRWVSIRSDLCAATIATTAGCIAYYKSGSAGLVGFSLTNAIGLSQTILSLVRNMNELEVELNSFQRIIEYTKIQPEENAEERKKLAEIELPESWPPTGQVEFRDVSVRYSPEGPDVLRNLNFTIQSGQRVAIIGRTGSGKSTLALSILRAARVASGHVIIDGVDINHVPLAQLRQSLNFLPQDPVLFAGDIRSNLDPSGELSETDFQSVLAVYGSTQPEVDRGNGDYSYDISAPTTVAFGGRNFSHGQKQMLSLARAMCRRSKIVILDEATASVDFEADIRMQQLIRSKFSGSTIITIAHRLSTIMDYDCVMVLEAGELMEMGSPSDLIKNEGFLWRMLQSSNA